MEVHLIGRKTISEEGRQFGKINHNTFYGFTVHKGIKMKYDKLQKIIEWKMYAHARTLYHGLHHQHDNETEHLKL